MEMQAWTALSAVLASGGVSVRNAFTRSVSTPPPGALHGTRVTSAAVPKGARRVPRFPTISATSAFMGAT